MDEIILRLIGVVLQVLAFGVIYICLRPLISGAVYYPSKSSSIETMQSLAGLKSDDKFADLGSGDGRILISLAKGGVSADGYEINPLLVFLSKRAIKKTGLENRVNIYWKSLWKANLSKYDLIVVYAIPYMMRRLERKFMRELKPSARVLLNIYPLATWKVSEKRNGVYLYLRSDQ